MVVEASQGISVLQGEALTGMISAMKPLPISRLLIH
jgi:hypothetical protein